MREIKFRAWDKEKKSMFYSDFAVKFNGSILWWESEVGYDALRGNDKVELMQFTGLKDKNGKEIYEGDIVKSENGNAGQGGVEFHNGSFVYRPNGAHWLLSHTKDLEVIGNIYENPDLLTP